MTTKQRVQENLTSVTDTGEAPVGAITNETYEVSCSGAFAFSEPVDTFSDAIRVAKEMEQGAERGIKITIVRVVDTVVRHFVVK